MRIWHLVSQVEADGRELCIERRERRGVERGGGGGGGGPAVEFDADELGEQALRLDLRELRT